MPLYDLHELIHNVTSAFVQQDTDPFSIDQEDPQENFIGLDAWTDRSDEKEPFWLDPETPVATQRAEDIHGVSPQPEANQRALDIHGVSNMTRHQLLAKARSRLGDEYEWGGTTKATGYDCSGLLFRIMQNNGYTSFPRTSTEIYNHSRKISVKKALKTPGAILWHEGHIALSAGDGVHTVEAMGEDYGVVEGLAGDRFTGGGILPETPTQGRNKAGFKKPKPVRPPKTKPTTLAIQPGTFSDLDLSPDMRPALSISRVLNEMPAMDPDWKATNDYAALAKAMAAKRGWTGQDWRAINAIIDGGSAYGMTIPDNQAESHWNPEALNPDSGATGIPQLLPSAHQVPKNWSDPRVQIAWLLDYIENRYETPKQALEFKLENGWY